MNLRIFSQHRMLSPIPCSGLRDKNGLLFDLSPHLREQALRGEEDHAPAEEVFQVELQPQQTLRRSECSERTEPARQRNTR